MSDVEGAFTRVVEYLREIGSRVPDYLRPPASESDLTRAAEAVGLTFPPDVVTLYRLADGIDRDRWYAERPPEARARPVLLPGMEFPSLAGAVEVTWELRAAAEQYEEPTNLLWRPAWFPVLQMHPDENVIVDCSRDEGEVWVVRWEADEIRASAPELATFFSRAVNLMREVGIGVEHQGYRFGRLPAEKDVDFY